MGFFLFLVDPVKYNLLHLYKQKKTICVQFSDA